METSDAKNGAAPERHLISARLSPRPVRTRLIVAAAAFLGAGTTLGGVLLLFHLASADPWLQPTPSLLEAQAQCHTLAERPARTACTRAVVEQARATGPTAGRFAKAGRTTLIDDDQDR